MEHPSSTPLRRVDFPRDIAKPDMYRNLYLILAGLGICLAIFAATFSGTQRGRADFVFNNATEPQTLDPGVMSGQPEGALAIGLFEGLTSYHPETLRPMPAVAENWEIDGLVYRFRLRQDAWWVRGSEIFEVDGRRRNVVAGDFVYSWRRMLHPETGSDYSYVLYLIEGAEAYEKEVAAHYKELIEAYKTRLDDPSITGADSLSEIERSRFLAELREFRDATWERLVKMRAPDDYTLEITLKSPAPYFLDITSFYPLSPVPREVVEKFDRQWVRAENIVSNGPYYLERWQFNAYIRMRKNRHYWEDAEYGENRLSTLEASDPESLQRHERDELSYLRRAGPFVPAGFETVDALAIEEQNTSLNLYINGDVDRIRELPNAVAGDLLREAARPGKSLSHLHHGVYSAVYYYNLNMELPVFHAGENGELGRKLRRALSLGFDRQGLIDLVTKQFQKPAYRLVPPGIPGYASDPCFGHGSFAENVAEAKRLVSEVRAAGVEIPRLKVLYNTSENHANIAVYLQAAWKKHLGIDIELANQEWGVYLDSKRTGNYEIARSGWIGDYNDPNTFLDMFTVGNQNNDPNYSNPHYDRIVKQYTASILDALATPESRAELLADVRSWPRYQEAIAAAERPDGQKLDAALEGALEAFAAETSDAKRLERAFEVRLLLFEVAEEMLMFDMPIIPFYHYTTTQLWPPELEGFYINARDAHPFKQLRWRGGERPTGTRYADFPKIPIEPPQERGPSAVN